MDTTRIQTMINTAISQDVFNNGEAGFISIMAKKGSQTMQDIPAAFEAYTLLEHFISKIPLIHCHSSYEIIPSIVALPNDKLVALFPIEDAELAIVAHWLTSNLVSDIVKQMPGVLAIPFSIEMHEETEFLLPEWFGVFYVDSDSNHGIPILTLRSILNDTHFQGDWVNIALERMSAFGLPADKAKEAVKEQHH